MAPACQALCVSRAIFYFRGVPATDLEREARDGAPGEAAHLGDLPC